MQGNRIWEKPQSEYPLSFKLLNAVTLDRHGPTPQMRMPWYDVFIVLRVSAPSGIEHLVAANRYSNQIQGNIKTLSRLAREKKTSPFRAVQPARLHHERRGDCGRHHCRHTLFCRAGPLRG
jgi:hypothetical protein